MGILGSPAQLNPAYFKKTPVRGMVQTNLYITFGASSIASQTSDHPDITATRTGAGTYNLTFPPSYLVAIIKAEEIYSPALTVLGFATTAKNVAAGTATVKVTNAAGAATDPATSDIITIGLELGSEQ